MTGSPISRPTLRSASSSWVPGSTNVAVPPPSVALADGEPGPVGREEAARFGLAGRLEPLHAVVKRLDRESIARPERRQQERTGACGRSHLHASHRARPVEDEDDVASERARAI